MSRFGRLVTIWLLSGLFLVTGRFPQHISQSVSGFAVALLERVGIYVHGCGRLSMAQPIRYGLNVLLAGDEQSSRCVPLR